MKKKSCLLCAAVTALGISAFLSLNTFSVPLQSDWKNLYNAKIQQIENDYRQGKRETDDTYDTPFYSLIDIDFDGIPEMYHALISTKSGDYLLKKGSEEIYYIKNRNVELGEIVAENALGLLPAYSITDTMNDRRGQFAFYNVQTEEAVIITKDSWTDSMEYGTVIVSELHFNPLSGILRATELTNGKFYRKNAPKSVDGYVFMGAASTYSVSKRKDNDIWKWNPVYIKPDESSSNSAKKDTNEWSDTFRQFVLNREYENTKQNYKTATVERVKFGLHDMDGNGIPELIIHNGAAKESDMNNYVYYDKNGSSTYAGTAGSGRGEFKFTAGTGFSGLFWSSGNDGYYPGYYYNMENNSVMNELVGEDKAEYINGQMVYVKSRRTDNEELYRAYRDSDSTFKMFTLSEINSIGWDGFVSYSVSHDNTLYADVNLGSWFYEAVKYNNSRKTMNGISDKMFAPENKVTRAMFITVLYRLEGEPSAPAPLFKDVSKGSWYEKAVSWENRNNIANGVAEDMFAPEDSITREQLAAILYRYAKYKRKGVNITEEVVKNYVDNTQISEYAISPMSWAIENRLISGTTKARLDPKGKATRAQAAVILQRLCSIFNI